MFSLKKMARKGSISYQCIPQIAVIYTMTQFDNRFSGKLWCLLWPIHGTGCHHCIEQYRCERTNPSTIKNPMGYRPPELSSASCVCYIALCTTNVTGLVESVSWWRHQMRTFFAFLALCEGNPPVTGGFPPQSQWRRALMFSLISAWTNGWANNRDAGD